jgi:hypothetical protein
VLGCNIVASRIRFSNSVQNLGRVLAGSFGVTLTEYKYLGDIFYIAYWEVAASNSPNIQEVGQQMFWYGTHVYSALLRDLYPLIGKPTLPGARGPQ